MSRRCAHLHEPYRTLRDGSLGWCFPWHFVPGYDRIVPPGHNSSLSRYASLATIALTRGGENPEKSLETFDHRRPASFYECGISLGETDVPS
jgi:hypothetical protein